MTAGIQGTGLYSKLGALRFQAKQVKNELDNKPMGPRAKKRKKDQLLWLEAQLREINAEIRARRKSRVELEAALTVEGRYFNKMIRPDSGVHRLLQAYGGPDVLAVAERAAKADAEAGFDLKQLIPSPREIEAGLERHIAAMKPPRSKSGEPKRR